MSSIPEGLYYTFDSEGNTVVVPSKEMKEGVTYYPVGAPADGFSATGIGPPSNDPPVSYKEISEMVRDGLLGRIARRLMAESRTTKGD